MSWIGGNWQQVAQYALQHAGLSAVPLVVGVILSVPLGYVANRSRLSRTALLAISGAIYAVPSLPLLIALPSLMGTKVLDPINVEVALALYTLALMLRSSADALASVDRGAKVSAAAVGYRPRQRFWAVELPLAGPVILAGARIACVSAVSLVTVGSLIGVNTLGFFFIDGYQRSYPLEIWVGVICTVLIALVLDLLLVLTGRLLMPWSFPLRRKPSSHPYRAEA